MTTFLKAAEMNFEDVCAQLWEQSFDRLEHYLEELQIKEQKHDRKA